MNLAPDWKILDVAREDWARYDPRPPWTLEELVERVRQAPWDLRREVLHNRQIRLWRVLAAIDGVVVTLVVQKNEAGEWWRLRKAMVPPPR